MLDDFSAACRRTRAARENRVGGAITHMYMCSESRMRGGKVTLLLLLCGDGVMHGMWILGCF